MKQHYQILKLASETKLPDQIDETFEFPIEIVSELIDAGYLKAIDASSFDGTAYIETKITLSGREYLSELQTQSEGEKNTLEGDRIRLFISHSSKDCEFVQALVDLLRTALSLSSTQIRCTSIDGFRLPGGADTAQQLKKEVHDADSFIGVISAESIKSLYVAFELGARWGAGLSLIPLTAPGTDTNILGGPLSSINALSSDSRSQILQLISDLSRELSVTSEPPSSYDSYIEAIINLKRDFYKEITVTSEPDSQSEYNLVLKYGVWWDKDGNAYCPKCKSPGMQIRWATHVNRQFHALKCSCTEDPFVLLEKGEPIHAQEAMRRMAEL